MQKSFQTPTSQKSQPLPLPEAVSVKRAALMLDCSTATVRRMIERKELKSFKVGTDLRVPYAEIRRIVEQAA